MYPCNVAFDRSGNVYVADYSNLRIQVFTPEGQYLRTFGSLGAGPGELGKPEGVAIDSDLVYVTEYGNHRVSVFSTKGKFLKSFGCKGEVKSQLPFPHYVHVNNDGFVLVADYGNDRIQVF